MDIRIRDDVEYGGMHWITVGPADEPGTSIVLHLPGADRGITDDERRTIIEMMVNGETPTRSLTRSDALPMTAECDERKRDS
jgi:hypothetical protein